MSFPTPTSHQIHPLHLKWCHWTIGNLPQVKPQRKMQLLPIQREFFEADARSYNHHNQAVLLTAPVGFDLPRVVEALYEQHDALRLRFVFADGIWQAVQESLTASMISESCVIETLPEDPSLQSNFIRERCAHYLSGLDITHGPLFRAVHLQGHA